MTTQLIFSSVAVSFSIYAYNSNYINIIDNHNQEGRDPQFKYFHSI